MAALSAEPASGKSRLLEVTELLVPNPVSAVNVSPAYLFRKVGGEDRRDDPVRRDRHRVRPKAKENEEIRGLLNAGIGGCRRWSLCRPGQGIVTEEIPAYSAVALAGLGWLPDTILSRSVIIRMRRRHRANSRTVSTPHSRAEGERVRTTVEVWAQSHRRTSPGRTCQPKFRIATPMSGSR